MGELAAPYDVTVQAVSKHLKVLEDAGLVSRSRDAQRRPVHLEAEVFDLMTKWIERYRQQAEERFQRLDALLARMDDEGTSDPTTTNDQKEQHHDHHDAEPRGHDRGRPGPPRRSPSPASSTRRRSASSAPGPTPTWSRQWMGPRSVDMDIETWDCRTGGCWRYAAGRDGEEIARFYGSFHEVRPGERLVQTFTWDGHARRRVPGDDDVRGARRRPLPDRSRSRVVDSMEAQAGMMASGMEVGINEGYEKLDELLERGLDA